jgi:hypothetical protein
MVPRMFDSNPVHEELPMQSPFRFDALSADEQTAIRRLFFRTLGVYSLLVLMLAVVVTGKIHLAPTAAVAAERTGSPLCAARDLKLVMLIEQLGEAKAVPGEQLADAFFTMTNARELCRAGRVTDALAVYDSIAITPVQSAAK